ncbi:sensor histidine kinase [Streptomyces neyagawaensis]|uniref:sensor histidine kinase n=1 Tax=Streptomyces neyagawaensis TaxID=42238 RepID=UPI0006E2E0F6|nr:histidine kinase [Streptomyces neyagawaensis]MCL6738101.1 histidine kinase [Streptomyces neyagawaensis]MDE1681802.1 histidine kinase [Streptomyces neyagawaensis]
MRGPRAWWRGKTTPAKVETYIRWSFYSFPALEVATFGLPVFGTVPMPQAGWLVAVMVVHAAVSTVCGARALDWVRGGREQPLGLMWAVGGVSALIGITASVLAGRDPDSDTATALGSMFAGVLIFGVGAITLGMRERRSGLNLIAGLSAGSGLLMLLVGPGPGEALATAIAVLAGTSFFAFTSFFSVWLVRAVYELDEARETRARLAVAEERLRFGRDLHDVIGRNLAVIALKSELAVQLARRERPEAVDQMTEVQRIAQESQREVRDVVRGYREADLGAELAGAQGVLEAAGIVCSVDRADTAGLPGKVQSALAWVVREGTTNVLRHGNAGQCTVVLKVTEGQVVLTVENDGIRAADGNGDGDGERVAAGAVAERSAGAGSGLAGLRERLAIVDGTLEAGPVGGEAFRVVARVPLAPQAAADPVGGSIAVTSAAGAVREVTS